MNGSTVRILPAFLLWIFVLTFSEPVRAQVANVSTRAAITVLDSTKEQDGLLGSVRRVKTENARIELKDGRPIEGPPQLVENTTYPIRGGLVGKEEYKYDERGNITEMTVRDDHGAILSREAYSYEFDKFGNWTKMLTNLVVFENSELKREPVEVTYRTLTYYFDDSIAKIVDEPMINEPKPSTAPAVPEPGVELQSQEVLEFNPRPSTQTGFVKLAAEPPPLLKHSIKSVESVAKPATDNTDRADHQNTANDLYLAGYAYLKSQQDREAIKAFRDSIKLNPAVPETHYGLGFSNFRLGRFRDAADAFKKAIALEPRMAKAHFGLSLAYQELGMTSGVMEEYRILETLDRSMAKKLAQTFPQFNFSCRLVRGCP